VKVSTLDRVWLPLWGLGERRDAVIAVLPIARDSGHCRVLLQGHAMESPLTVSDTVANTWGRLLNLAPIDRP
jgi:hypothetical protein